MDSKLTDKKRGALAGTSKNFIQEIQQHHVKQQHKKLID
jgi:hypothetical protein